MRAQRGFSLIELIITVALATLVLSIGVPSYEGLMQKNRAKSHIDEINAGLRLARQVAVEHGFEARVCARASRSLNTNSCGTPTDWPKGFVVQIATPAGGWETLLNKVYANSTKQLDVTYGGTLRNELRFRSSGNLKIGGQAFVKVNVDGCEATSVINIAGRVSSSSLSGC